MDNTDLISHVLLVLAPCLLTTTTLVCTVQSDVLTHNNTTTAPDTNHGLVLVLVPSLLVMMPHDKTQPSHI